jgi:DNA-binding response OmpR family regulator
VTQRPEVPSSRKKVLVVDDEESVRKLLFIILTKAGYQVRVAADGKAAEKMMAEEPADLVVTDLVMPEQEGIETIQNLRQNFPDTKIIAVSGAFDGQFLKAAKILGADAVFLKPFSSEKLVISAHNLLQTPD